MANIYKSNYTGEQIDNSVGLTQENTATQGQVLTANGTGGASWQEASVGTEVVANPTLSGSESDLTGLEINGTKYKVPSGEIGGGVKVYQHTVNSGTYIFWSFTSTPFTSAEDIWAKANTIYGGFHEGTERESIIGIMQVGYYTTIIGVTNNETPVLKRSVLSGSITDTVIPL